MRVLSKCFGPDRLTHTLAVCLLSTATVGGLSLAGCSTPQAEKASGPPARDIHSAATVGDLKAVEYWVRHDSGVVHSPDPKWGMTPLHYAALPGFDGSWRPLVNYVPLVRFLLENGANANATNMHGIAPLHLAVRWRLPHGSIIEESANAKEVTITITGEGTTGRFVIPESPIKRQLDIITMLLDRGANINSVAHGDFNRIPLHYAVEDGMKEVVALLLSKGADANAKVRLSGREFTPLELARELKREDLLTLLENHSSK